MQLDTFFSPSTKLSQIPQLARAADQMGFSTAWVAETQHNPFLASSLIAEHSQRMQVGTGIAVSFARSPAVMAHTAWDLSELSAGRFQLGLGTQVRGHIERRFGLPWPNSPKEKLREQIQAIRAFWANWQSGHPLNQRGKYYKLTLTSPFFAPDPIDFPNIPIWIAGVNRGLAELAGELADGFLVHPFHSKDYLVDHLLPAIAAGVKKSDSKTMPKIMVNAFMVTNDQERELARQQISFYASTPSYKSVLKKHGWEALSEELGALAIRKKWDQMPALITDEMIATFALLATEKDLPEIINARYAEIADQITLYTPFIPGQRDAFWRSMIHHFNHV